MSPVDVRNYIRTLISSEQESRSRREAYLNEVLQQRVKEIEAHYTEQFEKVRAGFESETEKFEKALKDRAQGVIKTLQIKHLDRLIDLVGRIRQIHNLHGGTNSSMIGKADLDKEPCKSTQRDLQNVIQFVDNLMAEQSSEDALSNALLEQFNFASNEELQFRGGSIGFQGSTTFNPSLRDQVLLLQQKSSNGVVANNNLIKHNNQVSMAANSAGSQPGGAATSYGNVTSGDGLPMSSGNILSPNTTPSQEFQNPTEATLSNPQIQNMHRSQTTANQFVKPGAQGRPRFVYELPKDFPFNEACIEKSLSNDLANSVLKSGSGGNNSNSHHTASNHDVNPEDVLRTFTNSLHSGGTLGAIHSSLTYYKEALASKEWSNLSPSNAYQNFMWKKNLVGEIQKLAKEISRIPTEEAKILADLSKSHLSHENSRAQKGFRQSNLAGPQSQGHFRGNKQRPAGMSHAEAISKGLGMLGNNESSILMDLNRASIQMAQMEAEELRQKAKRIVDDSATRLEPVVQSYTDAPLSQQLMQSQNPQHRNGGSNGVGTQSQPQNFIQYLQQPSTSIQDSQGLFPDRQNSSSQNIQIMYQNPQQQQQQLQPNDSLMHDSCVMFEDLPSEQHGSLQHGSVQRQFDARNSSGQSPQQIQRHNQQQAHPHLNYQASNERSQLSVATVDNGGTNANNASMGSIDDDEVVQHLPAKNQSNSAQRTRVPGGSIARHIQHGHRRHGSLVVGQHTIMQQVEGEDKEAAEKRAKMQLGEKARRSVQHDRDELSPKQLRNESLSVQRSSIAAKRKGQQVGFFSNDAVERDFTDMELEQIENAHKFQQTISFAQNERIPHWLEEANEIIQNKVQFQQTAGPNVQARNMLASKLKSSRRRGTQSIHGNDGRQTSGVVSDQATGGFDELNSRFGDQNLSNTALDNKGRAIKLNQNQEQTSGNLYDELSRVAEYQSSRSVLDGYSNNKPRNQQSNLNRTMQVKKNQQKSGQETRRADADATTSGGAQQYSREVISKSVLTNADRASPIISASGVTNGSNVAKMNIKKNQIKLVKGIATKRSSIQVAGTTSTGTGSQDKSKSVSREGRIKVKLVANKNHKNSSVTPGLDQGLNKLDSEVIRLSQIKDVRTSSVDTSQQNASVKQSSPKMSLGGRNERKLVMGTAGPSQKMSQRQHAIPTNLNDQSKQRDLSPQGGQQQLQSRLGSLQGTSQQQQRSSLAKKIPFKSQSSSRQDNYAISATAGAAARRDDSGQASNQRIRNNFFAENSGVGDTHHNDESLDSIVRQSVNGPSIVPTQTISQPQQNLKIRRNRKQAKRATPTIEESEDNNSQPRLESNERNDADNAFEEIAKNLRTKNQQQPPGHNIFIRRGSQYNTTKQNQAPQQPLQQNSLTNESESASIYKAGSINQSREAKPQSYGQDNSSSGGAAATGVGGKSRQPFVRTFKSHKSRQVEDLDRPFGTERVSFHKSALVANGQESNQTNMTQEEVKNTSGYKRPIGTVNNANAVTVRVQSHSQPPMGTKTEHADAAHPVQDPQIIPPPTELLLDEEQHSQEQRSNSAQLSGQGSINVTQKRPVVKMTAINFIQGGASEGQSKQKIQVSNFATNKDVTSSGNSQFSFHHPQQQPSQERFPTHSKKPSISAQLEASPYMTQQSKVPQNSQQAAANKRIIHLKRPSTNFQMSHSNQPSLVGKNSFGQRAASRVEQIDHSNELAFQTGANQGTTSGASMVTALSRPSAQIRISKKGTNGQTKIGGASHKTNNFV